MEEADGLVGMAGDGVLAMFAADCALVALASPEGVIGIAHCGWRGLLAGVIEEVVSQMRLLGASQLAAVRSPCIGPECYEVTNSVLQEVVSKLGGSVASRTSAGAAALDLREGVRQAAVAGGIARLLELDACTGCDAGWFSHRARGEAERFCLAIGGEIRGRRG